MTKDRIKDLQKNISWPNVSYERLSRQSQKHEEQNSIHNTNNQSTTFNPQKESKLIAFLNEIEIIRLVINKIDELTEQVKQIHISMLQPTATSKLGQELDDKTEEIKKLAYETSTKLKKMEQAQEHRENYDMTNAQWRIRGSQISVLTRRFRDTMIDYNKETVLHRERCKKVIMRELQISGHQRNNDELEEMLENGCPGTFSFSIMINTQKAQQTLDEIEARHRDIAKLESSIRELHSMFLDLAFLAANQGEMVDSIEHNVSKAVEYVEDAAEDVDTADQYRRKASKKKLLIFIGLLLLVSMILILLIVLIGYLTQRKSRGK